MPATRPVLGATENTLFLESSLFERALLSHVVNISRSLNPLDRCGGKEVLNKKALRLSAKSMSPCFWNEADSDVPGNRLWIGAIADLAPGDRTDRLAVRYTLNNQGPALAVDQSVLLNTFPDWPHRNTEVVEFAPILSGLPEFEEFGVIQPDWP